MERRIWLRELSESRWVSKIKVVVKIPSPELISAWRTLLSHCQKHNSDRENSEKPVANFIRTGRKGFVELAEDRFDGRKQQLENLTLSGKIWARRRHCPQFTRLSSRKRPTGRAAYLARPIIKAHRQGQAKARHKL